MTPENLTRWYFGSLMAVSTAIVGHGILSLV